MIPGGRGWWPALLVLCALLATACYPSPATREGRVIGDFYNFVLGLALVVVVIVWGLLTYAIVRYRRRPKADGAATDDAIPPQIGGHIGLEALWTGVPLLTIGVLFGMTLLVLNDVQGEAEARPDPAAVQLHVECFRWGWRMTYPADDVSVVVVLEPGPEAVVPVGRPLQITLTSADVVHAFYVPQFLYKRDAIPGREQVFELTVEQAGVYRGECAEFCGLYHARMPFSIRAVPDGDYQAWLIAQRAAQPTPAVQP